MRILVACLLNICVSWALGAWCLCVQARTCIQQVFWTMAKLSGPSHGGIVVSQRNLWEVGDHERPACPRRPVPMTAHIQGYPEKHFARGSACACRCDLRQWERRNTSQRINLEEHGNLPLVVWLFPALCKLLLLHKPRTGIAIRTDCHPCLQSACGCVSQ